MPRTATTFLFQRFQEHPSIFCPYRKETSFFTGNYGRGIGWYHWLYKGMGENQIGADVSPSYFLEDRAIDRIRDHAPGARVILGVRKPSEWALSWYTQVRTHLWAGTLDLEEFLTGYRYRDAQGEIWQDLRHGFVNARIAQYRQAFGDALLIYRYAAVRQSPLEVMNGIEDFLEVPRFFTDANFRTDAVNAASRRNIGLVTHLASRERFVEALGRTLPRSAVQAGRNLFVRFGTSAERPAPPEFTSAERSLVAEIFAEDDELFEQQFAEHPLTRGPDGRG